MTLKQPRGRDLVIGRRQFCVGAAILALGGCSTNGSTGGADDPTTFTIGVSPFQDTYLPVIGLEKGWFEAAGLNVELRTLAWNSVMPAVVSGDVDAAVFNTTGVVSIANADPRVIYAYGWNPFTEGSALMIRPGIGLQTIDELEANLTDRKEARDAAIVQLEGRTIVTTLGTDMGKQLVDALTSVDLSEDSTTIIDMDTDAGLAAFLSGTGDAYLGGVPQRGAALENGMEVGVSGPELAPPPINGLVTTNSFLDENRDDVLTFLNIMHRIVRYCDAETEAGAEIITKRLNEETAAGLTIEGFIEFWQNIELYAPNAAAASEMILSEEGIAYWRDTWDSDNSYLVDTAAIPDAVDSDTHFRMQEVWQEYVSKYGAGETGF